MRMENENERVDFQETINGEQVSQVTSRDDQIGTTKTNAVKRIE